MFEHWKDHFHPHEGNKHEPPAYQTAGAVALTLVVLAIVTFSILQTSYIQNSERFLSSVLPAVLVDLANEDRDDNDLAELTANETLARAAQLKANHMVENEYFAHDAPDGTTPWEWFAEAGYQYETAGENLAINFSDSADVERAWMDSPAHRENILEENFTEIGIATAKGEYEGEETIYVVQFFGRPSAAELAEREDGSNQLAQADTTSEEPAESEPNQEPSAVAAQQSSPSETTAPAPEPEADTPQPDSLAQAQPAPAESQSPEETPAEPATTTTSNETNNQLESTTSLTTFAEPAPLAQVQGESGIALTPSGGAVSRQASQLAHLVSQPRFLFKTLMLTLFALVALSLLVSVGVEAKRHHVDQAAKALGALVLLLAVFYFGSNFFFADTVVATEKLSEVSSKILVVSY
jgi:uncharacterized protein YkwD